MATNSRFEKYIRNCRQSDNSKNTDWVFEDALRVYLHSNVDVSPDAESDLRDDSWWEIKDQGRTGSCVGFAVADSVLRRVFFEKEWIQNDEELSVRYLWMASKETDEFIDRPTTFIESYGTSIKAALSIVQRYGIVLEKDLPFVQTEFDPHVPDDDLPLYFKNEKAFYAVAAQYRISGYFNLGQDPITPKDCQNWRMWLASGGGPIAIRIVPDEAFLSAEDVDGQLDNYGGAFQDGKDHACALVGFKNGRFIIRNSWGKDWGKKGYAFVKEEYAMKAVKEAYGVIFY